MNKLLAIPAVLLLAACGAEENTPEPEVEDTKPILYQTFLRSSFESMPPNCYTLDFLAGTISCRMVYDEELDMYVIDGYGLPHEDV